MAIRRICEFLDGSNVHYLLDHHTPAFTAQEVAQSIHVSGKEMAKPVIVWIDGRLVMAVVPAANDVSLDLIRHETHAHRVRLASETEFAGRFEGCQAGAEPPFGRLFGMETLVDRRLLREDQIAFNAGTHTDVIVMNVPDYIALARPEAVHIAVEPLEQAWSTALA